MSVFYGSYEAAAPVPEESDPERRPHLPAERWGVVAPAIGAADAQSAVLWCREDDCQWSHSWTFWPGDGGPSVVTFDEINAVMGAHHEEAHA